MFIEDIDGKMWELDDNLITQCEKFVKSLKKLSGIDMILWEGVAEVSPVYTTVHISFRVHDGTRLLIDVGNDKVRYYGDCREKKREITGECSNLEELDKVQLIMHLFQDVFKDILDNIKDDFYASRNDADETLLLLDSYADYYSYCLPNISYFINNGLLIAVQAFKNKTPELIQSIDELRVRNNAIKLLLHSTYGINQKNKKAS